MIEIVFNDSACGSFKSAKANYLKENPDDVFGFNLMLSVGDISCDNFIENRANMIEKLWSIYQINSLDETFNMFENITKEIERIKNRITKNDEVRIWYSNNPDEYCGMYWFIYELSKFKIQPKEVYIVKLPEYEYKENNAIVTKVYWGEIAVADWENYFKYSQKTTEVFCKYCIKKWKDLQKENSALRAVINGKLHSVDENIYDYFIYKEIEKEEDEFLQTMIIGRILGEYGFGITDSWLAYRMEKIIINKKAEIISEAKKGMPAYHRMLKKIK